MAKVVALAPGIIVALMNAAKRAQTRAGWNSAKPFLAMATDPLHILEDDADADAPDLLNVPLPEYDYATDTASG